MFGNHLIGGANPVWIHTLKTYREATDDTGSESHVGMLSTKELREYTSWVYQCKYTN